MTRVSILFLSPCRSIKVVQIQNVQKSHFLHNRGMYEYILTILYLNSHKYSALFEYDYTSLYLIKTGTVWFWYPTVFSLLCLYAFISSCHCLLLLVLINVFNSFQAYHIIVIVNIELGLKLHCNLVIVFAYKIHNELRKERKKSFLLRI